MTNKDDLLTEAIKQARDGDLRAVGTYLHELLPYLMAVSRDVAPLAGSAAREDIVQDAVSKLISLWRNGGGPDENPRGYLVAMMRNAVIDHGRSPRSRHVSFDHSEAEDWENFPLTHDPSISAIEISREREMIRAAFTELSPDHQAVLDAVVINGEKPRELVQVLGRSAESISSLLLRAKRALRRGVLLQHLRKGGEACAENATSLPVRIHDAIEDHEPAEPGMSHVHECARCRENWRSFAAMASAFGVLPLLTIGELIAQPSTAHASAEQAPEAALSAPRKSLDSGSGSGSGRLMGLLSKPATLIGALCAGMAAVALFAIAPLIGDSGAAEVSLQRSPQGGDVGFTVESTWTGNSGNVLVHLRDARVTQWEELHLGLQLPPGVTLSENPQGWLCDVQGHDVECFAQAAREASFSIRMQTENADTVEGEFSLELLVRNGEREHLGTAVGSL